MRVLVLDRIFNGHNMPRVSLIDLIDQRSQRRGLPRSRRSADDHEAALQPRQRCHSGRQSQFLERRNLRGQRPHRRRRASPLPMQIDAKPSQPFYSIRRIRDAVLLIGVAGVLRQGRQHHRLDLIPAQCSFLNRQQSAFHANRRRGLGNQQQIAALARDQFSQPIVS